MTPWRIGDEKPESAASRWSRHAVAALLLAGSIFSVFIAPISWQLLLIYVGLGLIAGILGILGELTAPIDLAIILFGVEAAAAVLSRIAPQWHAVWWQPVLIASGAAVVAYLTPPIFRRLRQ